MAKKICCVALVCVILGCNFCLTAYAADSMIWDFLFTWLYDTYTNIDGYGDIADDPDALIDYYSTDDGRRAYDLMTTFDGALPGLLKYVTVNDLDEAVAGRYMAAQLHKDHVDALYDSLTDYWSNDSAYIRDVTLDDIGITLDASVSVHGAFGSLGGSGPSVLRGTDYNNSSYTRFVLPDNFAPESNALYVFNGSSWYPPVIFVSTPNTVYHGVKALPRGLYYVLNSAQLLYVGSIINNASSFCAVYEVDSSNNVKSFYPHWFMDSGGGSNKSFTVYTAGSPVSLRQYAADGYMTYEDALSLYSLAVGIHVTTDDVVEPKSITAPDDIPYDDDDTVVVLVPVDQPGAPVYMSPTVYNNYYNNGDIVDSHDTTNNYFTDDQIDQIINNYNNYKSEYDDSKILGKLNTIIDKLEDIYKAIKNIDLSPTVIMQNLEDSLNPDPIYESFGDCVTDNLPLISEVKELVEVMNVTEARSGFDKEDSPFMSSSASGGNNDNNNDTVTSIYSGFNVDVGWYAPYREYVRNLLKIFCYILGVGGVWRAVCSVFGIHSGGGGDG